MIFTSMITRASMASFAMFPTVSKPNEKRYRCFRSKEVLKSHFNSETCYRYDYLVIEPRVLHDTGSNRARNFKWVSRFALLRFLNYACDYSLNCTLLSPITIPNRARTFNFNIGLALRTRPILKLLARLLPELHSTRSNYYNYQCLKGEPE